MHAANAATQANQIESTKALLNQTFGSPAPKAQYFWLSKETQAQIQNLIGHRYPKMRIRYWQLGDTRIWQLDEIGKEKYITAGFTIKSNNIAAADILAYREHRGYEIQNSGFLAQFVGLNLSPKNRLSGTIDSITGATLSVRAMRKMATLALWLNQQLNQQLHQQTTMAQQVGRP